jgi:GAF domain-containing protein/HAMP domain-containing protein
LIRADTLQNQSLKTFFTEGLQLDEGETYFSPLNVSQEWEQSTLSMAAPIYDLGERQGIFRFKIYAIDLFDTFQAFLGENEVGEFALVNDEGYYLYHTNPEKRWRGESAPGTSLEADYPEDILPTFGQEESGGKSGNNTLLVFHQVPFPKGTTPGWYVIETQPAVQFGATARNLLGTAAILLVSSTVLIGIASSFVSPTLTRPISDLTEVAEKISAGNLDASFPSPTEDEIGILNLTFKDMTNQLKEIVNTLEDRVKNRTMELERQSAQLEAAAEVGKTLATVRDPEQVLPLITNMISNRFDFYHVGIFLVDDNQEYAVLAAANSAGGRLMLDRGHRLKVGAEGIVGYATGYQEPRIALDVGKDAVFFNNPDLPLTRSEMALPLVVGDETLGALDIQSKEKEAFTEDDIRVLQVLADQVAIAINNSQLLAQTEEALEKTRIAYGERSRSAWLERLRRQQGWGYKYLPRANSLQPLKEDQDPDVQKAIEQGEIIENPDDHALTIPFKIRGQVVGVFSLNKAEPQPWTEKELQFLTSLSEQIGLVLENARLFEETQQRVTYEQLTAEITDQIRETLDVDMVLQTAIKEMRNALDLDVVMVQLEQEAPDAG